MSLIVRGYLDGLADDGTINNLSARVVSFFKAVVTDLANFRDGSNCQPHFSLRTLCRSLVHARHATRVYGLQRALFDGLAMNFQTLLDPPSHALMARLLSEHVQLKAADMRVCPAMPATGEFVRILEFWCPRGPLEPKEPTDYVLVPSVKEYMRSVLRAVVSVKFPVLLQGPTSAGKTSMVEYLVSFVVRFFV